MRNGEARVHYSAKLRSKCCVSFVGYRLFNGCEQRPQVYAQLQEPENIDESLRRWGDDNRVMLAAMLEKRPRQTGYSKAGFPGRVLKYFEFSIHTKKPAIRAVVLSWQTETERRTQWQRERDEDDENHILLDARTGEGYTTAQKLSTMSRAVPCKVWIQNSSM